MTADPAPTIEKAAVKKRQFKLLVNSVMDCAIYLLDENGCVASWNHGAARLKQYKAEGIIGQHFGKFYTEDDRRTGVPEKALKAKPGLKILLTSGYPLETLTSHSRHDPTLPVLNKPYRKVELGKRICEILDGADRHPAAALLTAASQIWH